MRQLCCCLSTFVTCKSKHPLSKICYFCVIWYTRWWRNYRNQAVLTVIYNPQNCTVRRWNHHKKMQADNGASINMVNLACLTIFRICCCVIIYKPHILLLSCQFVLCLYNDCLSSWYCTLFIISGCFGILSYLILYSTSQCCWTSILEMLLPSQNFEKEIVDKVEGCGLKSSGLGWGVVAGCYEESTESLGFIKSVKFHDWVTISFSKRTL